MSLSTPLGERIIIGVSGCSAAVARLVWDQEVAGSIPATPTSASAKTVPLVSYCCPTGRLAEPGTIPGPLQIKTKGDYR